MMHKSVRSVEPAVESKDTLRDSTDRDAVASCLAGNTDAFKNIVERHEDRLIATAYHLLGQRDNAADAVQETFMRAYRSLDSFGGEGYFGAWIGRIVVNVCMSMLRSQKSRPVADHGSWDWGGADRSYAQSEHRMILQTAMARLEVQDRSILLLRHVQGLSSQEISQIVGLPATTVRSRLARACDTLRSVLPERDLLFDVDTESITLAIVAGEEDR